MAGLRSARPALDQRPMVDFDNSFHAAFADLFGSLKPGLGEIGSRGVAGIRD